MLSSRLRHQRYARAREAGMPVRIEPTGDTLCDALRSRQIGAHAFENPGTVRRAGCAQSSDELVYDASTLLHGLCGIRVEPSGALAMGAVLAGAVGREHSRVWVVACGGNRKHGLIVEGGDHSPSLREKLDCFATLAMTLRQLSVARMEPAGRRKAPRRWRNPGPVSRYAQSRIALHRAARRADTLRSIRATALRRSALPPPSMQPQPLVRIFAGSSPRLPR